MIKFHRPDKIENCFYHTTKLRTDCSYSIETHVEFENDWMKTGDDVQSDLSA